MKALAIGCVVAAALCSGMAVPASAMPMSNIAAATSDLALGKSVRYATKHYRYRNSSRGYSGYAAGRSFCLFQAGCRFLFACRYAKKPQGGKSRNKGRTAGRHQLCYCLSHAVPR
jgi:hypothetical protein